MKYFGIIILCIFSFITGYYKGCNSNSDIEKECSQQYKLSNAMQDVIIQVECDKPIYFEDSLVNTKVYQKYDSLWALYNL